MTQTTIYSTDVLGLLYRSDRYREGVFDQTTGTLTFDCENKQELLFKISPQTFYQIDTATGNPLLDNEGNPVLLTELSLSIHLVNLPENGNGELVILDLSEGETKLKLIFPNSLNSPLWGDNELLTFRKVNNLLLWTSSKSTELSLVHTEVVTFDITPDGVDDDNVSTPFLTAQRVVDILKSKASFTIRKELSYSDFVQASAIINIHQNVVKQKLYFKDVPPIGVDIVGIPNENGSLPILDGSNIEGQFKDSRCLFIDSSRHLRFQRLAFQQDGKVNPETLQPISGGQVITALNCRRVEFRDCEFMSPSDPILVRNRGAVTFLGKIVFHGNTIKGTLFSVEDFSSVTLTHTGLNLTHSYNVGLSILFSSNTTINQFAKVSNFSRLSVKDTLIMPVIPNFTFNSVAEELGSRLTLANGLV